MIGDLVASLDPKRPVLIAGPTASGKSALALAIAERQGGTIVNADASQVYDCWRVITARPSVEEEKRAPHALYGHLPFDAPYSTGQWLRDVAPLLDTSRPIIVGGTGLYFSALVEGLAEIPPVPAEVRAEADGLTLKTLTETLDAGTAARIDMANRARVQRAWEVLRATGTPLATWQDQTPPPLLGTGTYQGIVLDSPKTWLTPRITARFSAMLEGGGIAEARAMMNRYDPALPSCRAIGVAECMAVARNAMSADEAAEVASIATRQYAKRQRTWLRARFGNWLWVDAERIAAN